MYRTTEGEKMPHLPRILAFIREETARQKEIAEKLIDDRNGDFTALNEVFREMILGE